MKAISILVAHDHEVVRGALCTLLETQPNWNTFEASDGGEALSKCDAQPQPQQLCA